jgi:hypothetical protein
MSEGFGAAGAHEAGEATGSPPAMSTSNSERLIEVLRASHRQCFVFEPVVMSLESKIV